jgi:6,7-dimethyl-8-ribityllumazine synthase
MTKKNISEIVIGVVSAKFNDEVVREMADACLMQMQEMGIKPENIVHNKVPGALEIPFVLKKYAEQKKFDVLIAIGIVIRGDTYHFEIVSNESANGIMQIQLDHSIPVINAVLTTNSKEEALKRTVIKGEEAAHAAIEMAQLVNSL